MQTPAEQSGAEPNGARVTRKHPALQVSGLLGVLGCLALVIGTARCESRFQDDRGFPISDVAGLSTNEVAQIAADAMNYSLAVDADNSMVVTVVDREGRILIEACTVPQTNGNPSRLTDVSGVGTAKIAVSESRAMTASYLSSNGEAFTTQTAFFIIQEHFPPGTRNEDAGPLFGVEMSNFPGGFATTAPIEPTSGNPVSQWFGGIPDGTFGVGSDIIFPCRFDIRDDSVRRAAGQMPRTLANDPVSGNPGVDAVTAAAFQPLIHSSIRNGTPNALPAGGRNAVGAGIIGLAELADPTNPGNPQPIDSGGLPLHRLGAHVGGIGMSGSANFPLELDAALYAQFNYQPPSNIRADRVFVDGVRFPYSRTNFGIVQFPNRTLTQLVQGGFVHLIQGPRSTLNDDPTAGPDFNRQQAPQAYINARTGTLTNASAASGIANNVAAANSFGIFPDVNSVAMCQLRGTSNVGANLFINGVIKDTFRGADIDASLNQAVDPANVDATRDFRVVPQPLTFQDVSTIIRSAAEMATNVRAGIRRPLGSFAVTHICVVDQNGQNLGTFAMDDATVFSYDVAFQKARTCTFFSDNTIAFTARAIGWVAQPHFPPGLDPSPEGPLFGIQGMYNPLGGILHPAMNGFQVFPGGMPIYKNGVMVGGVGISGDGVDQDDQISFGGQLPPFSTPPGIRCDVIDEVNVVEGLRRGLIKMRGSVEAAIRRFQSAQPLAASNAVVLAQLNTLLDRINFKINELQNPGRLTGVPIPWIKFARNPYIFDTD